MMNILSNNKPNIPGPALYRLPWYLAYAKLLKNEGHVYVSTTQIASKINVSSSQIAKDLSYVEISGKTRVGYNVATMVEVLEDFLGFNHKHNAVLFGVGNLGAALLSDSGIEQFGLKIVAGFDINKQLEGTTINNIPVYHTDNFNSSLEKLNAKIGILAVPISSAQQIADMMIEMGLEAIWNFTPFRLNVPEGIIIQNTSIYAHLAVMFNKLKMSPLK